MNILIACYSRTGHTAQLADAIAVELRSRGHAVAIEKIAAQVERNKWRLALPLLPALPILPFYLAIPRLRRWWLHRYPQARQEIRPLEFREVSRYDAICIGGPKWLYISYPIAHYLEQVEGLAGKRIGAFATFCGPPLPVFEIEMLFTPLARRISAKGGETVARLAVSSGFHEFFFFREMEYVFRALSWIFFRRSLSTFSLENDWGGNAVQGFCDTLCALPENDSERT